MPELTPIPALLEQGQRRPNYWVAAVKRFNVEKLPFQSIPDRPALPNAADRVYLMASLTEEMSELFDAFALSDINEVGDAIVDSIYVLIGIGLACGLPLEAIFEEVQRSNMDKRPAAPNTKGRKALVDGKYVSMKPEGWVAPRVADIIACSSIRTGP